ncbi:OB-fold nucleic acid binding domain-containing protein, partial [Richelia intracellularis]|uniref:OB-fold nucleic acid binding domain-containing protein n=1 Tax=Richelia intracellularis TaxID=1164990 RepID=UPI0005C598E7
MRTYYCGEIRTAHIGESVTLYGWVDRRRDHGGVIFLDLRDRSGIVQIVSDPQHTPDSCELANSLRNECVVEIQGKVTQRPKESLNKRIPTGEVEIYAEQIKLINGVVKNLPFQVSTAETDPVREELRLKYRYLDVRRSRMASNLQIRHQVVKAIRCFLENQENFIEVETPM